MKKKYATYEIGGLMRCCLMSIPRDKEDRVLAGVEGEVRRCQWCKDDDSGVRFKNGRWRAAWIKDDLTRGGGK